MSNKIIMGTGTAGLHIGFGSYIYVSTINEHDVEKIIYKAFFHKTGGKKSAKESSLNIFKNNVLKTFEKNAIEVNEKSEYLVLPIELKDDCIHLSKNILEWINDAKKSPLSTEKIKAIGLSTEEYEPQILILKEKHGDLYYIINNPDDLQKASLSILKTRMDSGWYQWMNEMECGKSPEYTIEDVEKLPDSMASIKKEMISKISLFNKKTKESQMYQNMYKDIISEIESPKGNAFSILLNNSNGEYEGLSLETPIKL